MYRKFYGFKEKPFEITPDPSYVYLSDIHQEALSYLQYAIKEAKGFSVITGEAGTGKTTLVHKLLSNLSGGIRTSYVFNPMMDRNDFLQYICHDFGITTDHLQTRGQCLTALHNFLLECFKNNEKVFLIIDEAQCLAPELLHEVRLLTNLETSKYKLLHVILLGQPELDKILAEQEFRPLKQRITVRYHLRPLHFKEMKEYINYRLKRSGSRNIVIFDEAAQKAIYKYSKGIPRVINILCDNALLTGFSQEKNRINKKIIKSTIADMENSPKSISIFIKSVLVTIMIIVIIAVLALLSLEFPDLLKKLWR
jgi:general secretion pathway protein A